MSKRYWITGGGTGIGAALALLMAKQGMTVFISGRRPDPLEKIASQHPNIHTQICDVTDPAMVAKALKEIGQLDGAILNAGAYDPGPTHQITPALFDTQMQVNYFGVIHACAALLPDFLTHGGHLVLVASLAGLRGLPNASGYGPSKAAVISFAESLYAELYKSKVRVQLVNPGFVKSALTDKNDFAMPFLMTPEKAAEAILKGMMRKRFDISFPRSFAMMLKLLRHLPYSLYFPLVSRMTQRQTHKNMQK